ncbi:serine/Arginine-related protein 53-like, partial [Lynx rufus]|uniref:serine/Arginine-related protein 53-like n=1 Tax=Herpailurus yagouaroundi TaxID=1608482 RepID=UPI001AD6ECAA
FIQVNSRSHKITSQKERTLLRIVLLTSLHTKHTDIIPPPLFLDQATLVEQVKRVKEIEAIESDSFVQQTFRSSKEVKKSVEPGDVKHTTAASGPASVVADPPSTEKEIDPSSIPTTIKYQDDNSLAHPNLFIEKADAEEKWFKRLIALRQERLMGSPVA